MHIELWVLGIILTIATVAVPYLQLGVRRARKAQKEQWFLTQLKLVRQLYPELHDVPYARIAADYDVSALYQNIGRREIYQRAYMQTLEKNRSLYR